jgi:hypothetical protein
MATDDGTPREMELDSATSGILTAELLEAMDAAPDAAANDPHRRGLLIGLVVAGAVLVLGVAAVVAVISLRPGSSRGWRAWNTLECGA